MHPDFLQMMIDDRQGDLERQVERAYLRRGGQAVLAAPSEAVVLRLCSVHDDDALERLAALDGRPAPSGRHVLAEVDGTIVAALPLGGGSALADPFRVTAHLVPLLELRARQLAPESRRRVLGLWGAVRGLSRA